MNVGKIIKVVAVILFFIIIATCLYTGAIIWKSIEYDNSIVFFIAIIIGSVVSAFLGSILLYGYGDLIDTNKQILKELKK